MNKDLEHLRLLSIFHYILGGLTALFGCFPIIHIVIGVGIISGKFGDDQAMRGAGPMFIIMGTVFVLAAWVFAMLVVAVGRLIAQRQAYLFCLVVAGLQCMFVPFGTVLGVCTIVVLLRPQVKALFYADTPLSDQSPT